MSTSPARVALYSRVSTTHQDDQAQYEELLALCEHSGWTVVRTFRERISGTKGATERPELKRLLLAARQRRFDKVVVWSVDRLGRSMRHLINVLGELHDAKIEVFSYKQGIDTSTPMGSAMWQMMGIFAEMENNLRKERQALGIAKALANGVKFGRRPMAPQRKKKLQREIVELRQSGLSIGKIQSECRCSIGLIYDTLRANGLPTAQGR